jgi:hypothetical protein
MEQSFSPSRVMIRYQCFFSGNLHSAEESPQDPGSEYLASLAFPAFVE